MGRLFAGLSLAAAAALLLAAPAVAQGSGSTILEACGGDVSGETAAPVGLTPFAVPPPSPCTELFTSAFTTNTGGGLNCPEECKAPFELFTEECRDALASDATTGRAYRRIFDACDVEYSASGSTPSGDDAEAPESDSAAAPSDDDSEAPESGDDAPEPSDDDSEEPSEEPEGDDSEEPSEEPEESGDDAPAESPESGDDAPDSADEPVLGVEPSSSASGDEPSIAAGDAPADAPAPQAASRKAAATVGTGALAAAALLAVLA